MDESDGPTHHGLRRRSLSPYPSAYHVQRPECVQVIHNRVWKTWKPWERYVHPATSRSGRTNVL